MLTKIGSTNLNLVPLVASMATVTDTTNLSAANNVVLCNKATAMTVNLPTAVGISGKIFVIKNINVGAVTITPSGIQTIDGQASQSITMQYNSYTIVSDGSNWHII